MQARSRNQAGLGTLTGALATASQVLSGATVLALFGMMMLFGHDGLTMLIGLMAGLALAAILIAPHTNRAGLGNPVAFVGIRYGAVARLTALLVAATASGLLLAAEATALAQAAAVLWPVGGNAAVPVGVCLLAYLLAALLASMRGLSEAQAIAYPLLLAALALPVALLAMMGGGSGEPLTPLTFGKVLQDVTSRELQLLEAGLADPVTLKPFVRPFISATPTSMITLTLSVGLGLAVMPHILQRPALARSRDGASSMLAIAMLLVLFALLALTPMAAAARHGLLTNLAGSGVGALPAWLYDLSARGFVKVCGVVAVSQEAVADACRALPDAPGVVRLDDIELARDAALAAVPGLMGLPLSAANVLAAGIGLGALLAAAWLGVALVDGVAEESRAAPVWRVATLVACVAMAAAAGVIALGRSTDIATLMSWGLALAAGGLAPALLAGIWWRRASAAGAVAGILTGSALTAYYIIGTRYFAPEFYQMWSALSSAGYGGIAEFEAARDAFAAAEAADQPAARAAMVEAARNIANWWGLRDVAAGALGALAGSIVLLVVSLVTPAPKGRAADLIEAIRKPHEGI